MDDQVIERGVELALGARARGELQREVQDVERMFLVWLEEGQPGPRKLAALTGVSEGEARKVLRSGVFQRRYMEETEGFRAIAAPYVKTRAQAVMDDVIDRLHEIVTRGDEKAAVAASRVLAGMIENDKVEVHANQAVVDARVLSIASDGLRSIDDVRRLVAASIDGNVSAVEESRAARRS